MTIELPKVSFSELEIEKFIHSSESYFPQYGSLRLLGASISNADEAMSLALAVYGWMPTILRSLEISNEQVELVRQSKDIGSAASVVRDFAIPPVNNSWVGSSKFLHFLNPDCFPIWDSHVARAFGWARRDQYESSPRYIAYMMAMRDLLPLSEDSTSQTISRIKSQFGYVISPLRALEFLIYSESRMRHRGQKA
jgi:hypothetical protein